MQKGKCQNYMSLKVLSKAENLETVCLAVRNFARKLNFSEAGSSDIETSVAEAVQNCILHAYKNEEGYITVIARILNGMTLEILVKDEGVGIANVERAREPLYTTGDKNSNCTGLGFTVMECFMTSVKVCSTLGKGTTVRMRRSIGQ